MTTPQPVEFLLVQLQVSKQTDDVVSPSGQTGFNLLLIYACLCVQTRPSALSFSILTVTISVVFCRHGLSSHKHFVRRLFPPHHRVTILLTLHNLSVELGQTDFLWRWLPKLLRAARMIRVRGSSAAGGLRVGLAEHAQVRIERCALQVFGKSVG